jgi:hypothetical protein
MTTFEVEISGGYFIMSTVYYRIACTTDLSYKQFCANYMHTWSRDHSFSMVTKLWAGRPMILSSISGKGKYFSPQRWDRIWALSRILSHWYPWRLSDPGRKAVHLPQSIAEVRNAWCYTFTPPYVFMAWCLIKHKDSCIFTLIFNVCLLFNTVFVFYVVHFDEVSA